VDLTDSFVPIAVRVFFSDNSPFKQKKHNPLTEIFRLPYEIFVDASPGQALYHALGMGHVSSCTQKARSTTENAVGSYVRHGAVSGLAMVVAHALRVGMPVWERGGDSSQLGGEFVLGPGYVPPPSVFFFIPCSFSFHFHTSRN
jgi:hypothetical protein